MSHFLNGYILLLYFLSRLFWNWNEMKWTFWMEPLSYYSGGNFLNGSHFLLCVIFFLFCFVYKWASCLCLLPSMKSSRYHSKCSHFRRSVRSTRWICTNTSYKQWHGKGMLEMKRNWKYQAVINWNFISRFDLIFFFTLFLCVYFYLGLSQGCYNIQQIGILHSYLCWKWTNDLTRKGTETNLVNSKSSQSIGWPPPVKLINESIRLCPHSKLHTRIFTRFICCVY